MNNDFYLEADSTSNYRILVKKLFILNAHKLPFFLYLLDLFSLHRHLRNFLVARTNRFELCLPFW